MTRDDIIRMAREAGFVMIGNLQGAGRLPELLEQFAALVAAAEREECARLVEKKAAKNWVDVDAMASAIRDRARHAS